MSHLYTVWSIQEIIMVKYKEDSWYRISILKLLQTLIDINPHFENICSTTADVLLHQLVVPLILLVANVYVMYAICIELAW